MGHANLLCIMSLNFMHNSKTKNNTLNFYSTLLQAEVMVSAHGSASKPAQSLIRFLLIYDQVFADI